MQAAHNGCMLLCRGHNGKVKSVAWLPDDTKLVSAGVDGAVYEWRLKDFKRSKENVLKVLAALDIAGITGRRGTAHVARMLYSHQQCPANSPGAKAQSRLHWRDQTCPAQILLIIS